MVCKAALACCIESPVIDAEQSMTRLTHLEAGDSRAGISGLSDAMTVKESSECS